MKRDGPENFRDGAEDTSRFTTTAHVSKLIAIRRIPDLKNRNVIARWPSTTARIGDSTGGCIFKCSSGDCKVDQNGLPVELLHFGVE